MWDSRKQHLKKMLCQNYWWSNYFVIISTRRHWDEITTLFCVVYCHYINLDCCTLCRYCFDILVFFIVNHIKQTPVVVSLYALVPALHAHANSQLSLAIAEEYTCIKELLGIKWKKRKSRYNSFLSCSSILLIFLLNVAFPIL